MINTDNDVLSPIYDSINWETPKMIRCEGCKGIKNIIWPPKSGSHPSSLSHFEAILGRFAEPRTKARILVVLEAPRSDEKGFKIAAPNENPTDLAPDEHRYFCLTSLAWRSLKLDKTVGPNPCWPTEETAPYFLRRYFCNTSWSYDGLLTYFLYLFKPEAAIITNLAKCHFGESQRGSESRIYNRCADIHLKKEVSLLQPNLLISLGSQCNCSVLNDCVPSLTNTSLLNLRHPAARLGHRDKFERLVKEVMKEEKSLYQLGYDVTDLVKQWERDASRAVTL